MDNKYSDKGEIIFCQDSALQNIVFRMAAILSEPSSSSCMYIRKCIASKLYSLPLAMAPFGYNTSREMCTRLCFAMLPRCLPFSEQSDKLKPTSRHFARDLASFCGKTYMMKRSPERDSMKRWLIGYVTPCPGTRFLCQITTTHWKIGHP